MTEPSRERSNRYRPTDEDLQCIDRRQVRSELLDYWNTAEVMCIDSDLRIFHRFNELRVFVILRQQRRLQAMTSELDRLRKEESQEEIGYVQKESTLNNLTRNIETTLREYGTQSQLCFEIPADGCRCSAPGA